MLFAFCATTGISQAAVVKEGADFNDVSKAMAECGYSESGLQMGGAGERTDRFAFWSVDEGILIVLYSLESKRVLSVSYWLRDERPKATSKTFQMRVTSFDTESGAMVVQTHPTKREKDGAGQPATRPESKSEGIDKPQPESEGRSR